MTFRCLGLSLSTFAFLFLSTACGSKGTGAAGVPSFPPTDAGPPELAYCSSVKTISSPATITGRALYKYRTFYGTKTLGGLGYVETVPRPVRFAEVRVLDSSGAVAQCGETDNTGNFSIDLPVGTATYTVQVNSRSKNSSLIATVFDLPETKVFYSLTKSVTPNVSKSIGDLTAAGDGDLKGGAFNILDQLLIANEYLRTEVSNCGTTFPGCNNFTVTPKIEVFWKKGFNPGSYFDSDPLSFYLPGYGRLFILGGVNGDVDHTDTDHFDNSVIIHEFGHFLEDKMFASDSPGGSHNGNKIVDPRLAWSEGWGNFLQAAVQNNPYYIDTVGNRNGTTGFHFYAGLENIGTLDAPSAGPAPDFADGEGNFREFSVTRLLWDSIDSPVSDDEPESGGFPQIWAALTDATGGFKDSSVKFRSIGTLHEIQRGLAGATDWDPLRTLEKQKGDTSDYASYVTAQAGCATVNMNTHNYSIAPVAGGYSTSNADLFRNNDFYYYKATSATSNIKFRLQYASTGSIADLDFYLYNETARFGDSTDMIGVSDNSPTATGTQTESMTIKSLPAGSYLINVSAYTGDGKGIGSANTYKIQRSTNGGSTWTNLCEPL